MEVGKQYTIIYDDKGFKPVVKKGRIEWIKENLFKLDTNKEELNLNNIIRAIPIMEEVLE